MVWILAGITTKLKDHRGLAMIIMLSMLVRISLLALVLSSGVAPLYDEEDYLSRGVAMDAILDGVLVGNKPKKRDLALAYGRGTWPPLQSLVIGMGVFVSGSENPTVHLAVARTLIALVSVATTIVVYALTRLLVNRRAGLVAAAIHTFYPTFISYSHLLWSETLFIFVLLLAILCFVLSKAKPRYAALAGLFLGLCCLTRSQGLVYLIVLPVWALFDSRAPGRLLRAGIISSTAVVVILPWLIVLYAANGRIVPLSTSGLSNLYLGNNAHVITKLGSSWGIEEQKKQLLQEAREYARDHRLDRQQAMAALAFQEIERAPRLFVLRSLSRLRMLWSSDSFYVRHILIGRYPPMSYPVVCLLWGFGIVSYLILLLFAFRGTIWGNFEDPRQKWLLIVLVASGCVLPAMTVAMSRFNVPLQALMLPLAGAGIAAVRTRRWADLLLEAAFVVAMAWVVLSTLPAILEYYVQPISPHYEELIERMEGLLGM